MAVIVHQAFPLRGGMTQPGDILRGEDEQLVRANVNLMKLCSPVNDGVFAIPSARQPAPKPAPAQVPAEEAQP